MNTPPLQEPMRWMFASSGTIQAMDRSIVWTDLFTGSGEWEAIAPWTDLCATKSLSFCKDEDGIEMVGLHVSTHVEPLVIPDGIIDLAGCTSPISHHGYRTPNGTVKLNAYQTYTYPGTNNPTNIGTYWFKTFRELAYNWTLDDVSS